MALANMT